MILKNSEDDNLISLEGVFDENVIVELYKLKDLKVTDVFIDNDDTVLTTGQNYGNKPNGVFSKLAMVFGIGHGIRQGIHDAVGKPREK